MHDDEKPISEAIDTIAAYNRAREARLAEARQQLEAWALAEVSESKRGPKVPMALQVDQAMADLEGLSRQVARPGKRWMCAETCPACGHVGRSQVVDSRRYDTAKDVIIRMRRCRKCRARWRTGEVILALERPASRYQGWRQRQDHAVKGPA